MARCRVFSFAPWRCWFAAARRRKDSRDAGSGVSVLGPATRSVSQPTGLVARAPGFVAQAPASVVREPSSFVRGSASLVRGSASVVWERVVLVRASRPAVRASTPQVGCSFLNICQSVPAVRVTVRCVLGAMPSAARPRPSERRHVALVRLVLRAGTESPSADRWHNRFGRSPPSQAR